MMMWIELDPESLPRGEVLAANFKEGSFGYKEKLVGSVWVEDGIVTCESSVILENCTHYIDINKFDL